MTKVCCVCNEPKETKDNVIFTCKGQGCDVSVHQGCYGIVTVPTGQWFCRKCESQERAARVRCELCPRKEGALKRTDSGGWAHVACALYIPEVAFGNNRIMEPIITSKLPRERFSKSCYICEERGNDPQSTYGACMSCHKPSCRQAFHVTCAQREGLLCEEEDSRDTRNVIYCGYCSTHHKKMLRQKHKQALHKPFPPPSTSNSIALYPTTPTSSSPNSSTPLSAISSLVLSEGGGVEHKLERTRSGSPVKVTAKRERPSLSDLPIKRTSTDSSINPSKPKRRRRKPSSSNESTTSEAPSNSSDFSLIPVIPSSSPHLAPGLPPLSLPGVAKDHLEGGRVQKGRPPRHEEVVQMMEVRGDNFSASAMAITQTGEGSGDSERRVNSSSSSEQNSRIQAPPPRSLQDLLERQWEQTAHFILDQAGKQNNAGSMLAHLHTLQSENRQMQSRIMDLASQREFYIAINTKLRQTLAEHELGHLPNGVQGIGNGLQQIMGGGGGAGGEAIIPMDTMEHKPRPSRPNHAHQQSTSVVGVESSHGYIRHSNTLSRDDQDTYLQAHFATNFANSSSSSIPYSRDQEDTPPLSRYHYPHQSMEEGTSATPPHAPNTIISTRTQISTSSHHVTDATPLSCGHTPILEYPNHPPSGTGLSQPDPTLSPHEITQVTNSVHAPISSLTPLPNDGSDAYSGGVANVTPYKKDLSRNDV